MAEGWKPPRSMGVCCALPAARWGSAIPICSRSRRSIRAVLGRDGWRSRTYAIALPSWGGRLLETPQVEPHLGRIAAGAPVVDRRGLVGVAERHAGEQHVVVGH